jgi:hypothetical protein
LSEAAVLFHIRASLENFLRVFIGNTLASVVVSFGIFGSPPIAKIAGGIKLTALIVEAIDDLVADNGTDCAVVDGIIQLLFKIQRLQDASREVDGIELRIVISVDGGQRGQRGT